MLAGRQAQDASNQTTLNEFEAGQAVQEDAETAPEHLSEAADELESGANRSVGAESRTLRNKAAADRSAADQVLEQGEAQIDQIDQNAAGAQLR